MQNVRFGRYLFLVIILAAVGQFANTIFVPASSLIANSLHTRPTHVQSLMAAYLLSYGASQFFYGPFADRYGRRPTILLGLLIFAIGTIIATFALNIQTLLLGCFVQGLGIGSAGAMIRTVMRDLFTGKELLKANSIMSATLVIAPIIAPLIGGLIATLIGWRAIFAFLLAFSAVVFALQFKFFAETHPAPNNAPTPFNALIRQYKSMLCHRQFIGYITCLTVSIAGITVFEASAGVLFASTLHYSPNTVSLLFIAPLPGYFIGSYLATHLNHRHSIPHIMKTGISALILGSVSMLALAHFGYFNAYAIVIPMFFYFIGAGLMFPLATTGALIPFGHIAGAAGAFIGAIQNLGSGVFTTLSALIPQNNAEPLAILLCMLTLITITAYYSCIASHQETTEI
ncbi:Multidrug resistance protein D [Piscirickettsia salmonis]|uniref:Bcr/CflA family efflux transporter n=1 Tax=Piscirickettsia salmonis TaxID=1238 RepID=A0A1L6T9A7_PISSA|nr:Bcr/CflA family efflux MFS transporter [Piscirickettsia salmonis]AKP73085.1 hypothetical protein PSLF89_1059 [Piscirickettsia salmonis LF-89 = ATCC VR-1361]ALB21734.1 Bcr/CflA family drug resistance efflux transporter [Piscirickettsia salmonis]ALY01927.1 hypothetical protein AWE47_02785 [Piscirickettsia salmonis]AMA41435.1 hypothetical protein AWJ11_02770 [Piscirickettsia salmonis]AOS33924.1 hypothetical protein AVM72_00020 [Piscirickettsia salmonis]